MLNGPEAPTLGSSFLLRCVVTIFVAVANDQPFGSAQWAEVWVWKRVAFAVERRQIGTQTLETF